MYHGGRFDSLYDLISGDEDARVCKDIPESACDDQPGNFFAYLGASLFGKVADELASARLVLPWLFGAVGAPAALVGFLVPVREAGVLLPQLAVAAWVRRLPRRKWVWVAGAALSGLSLLVMALAALLLEGTLAGWVLLASLVAFSLARGLCSVAAKDVLGKTVSKSRRGRLMGTAAGLAGGATLLVGIALEAAGGEGGVALLAGLLFLGAALWLPAAGSIALIREVPGSTGGGGNALTAALDSLVLVRDHRDFRRYVIARALLLAVALAPPFYVLLAQARGGGAGPVAGLGALIIAGGVAGSLSAPLWGWLCDRSSRLVIVLGAALAGVLGIGVWALSATRPDLLEGVLPHAALFLLVTVAHGGVRVGRKVYLVDLATADNRAAMVAVSNTLIGGVMLAGGTVGVLADALGPEDVLLGLGVLSLVAAVWGWRLADVRG